MKKAKEIGRKALRVAKYSALAALLLHAGGAVRKDIVKEIQQTHPTPTHTTLEESCNTTIYSEPSEEHHWPAEQLIEGCKAVQGLEGYTPSSIQIDAKNYMLRGLLSQISTWLKISWAGRASPITRSVELRYDAGMDTVVHELAHIKTFNVLEEHPEFRERWEKLALDEHGDTLYKENHPVSYAIGSIGWTDLIRNAIESDEDKEFVSLTKLAEQGFISDYAKRAFYEDVAELTAEALYGVGDPHINNPSRFPLIAQKLELLTEYGFIPSDFIPYISLSDTRGEAWECHMMG